MLLVATVVLGLLIGGLTGLLGAGGGILAVPALVHVVGVPLETAISTSLVLGAVGPVAAVAPRLRGGVEWRTVLAASAAGMPAAFGGTAVGTLLPDDVVMLAFAGLMVASGVQMLRSGPRPDGVGERPRSWILRGLAVGALVGFLTGLLGVGGGFITVPALVLGLGLPVRLAIGTSLVLAVVNSVAGLAAHAGVTDPDWAVALAFVGPSMLAAFGTAFLATRLDNRTVQRSFAGLVLVVAVFTVARVFLA
ncbi:sulfite exporter TauE/SafE family protein [Pseudonocardia sp. C8]|uniref:sulfite exporter TauE/SafE family protein n=1 Tax=Pseudonocardia sp. C8 TaxID=2762759 RepID=UPI0016435730|nr:sulfite exporter TauE/SafE family protein [Pseudonocardia sp. C8]MBC3194888.1 sulfite exporter TauE/SafE family protein [Pseudonocardia sp. C8]